MSDDAPLFSFGVPETGSKLSSNVIRNLLEALARTNYTSDASVPSNPRPGMMRVNASNPTNVKLELYYNSTWVEILQNLGTTGSAASYATQSYTSSTTWIMDHNFGRRPIVQCIDGTGAVIQPLSIEHTSLNRVTVQHSSATAGQIIVTG